MKSRGIIFDQKVWGGNTIRSWVDKQILDSIFKNIPIWWARKHPPTKHCDYKAWRRWDRKAPRHRRSKHEQR